jgi:hypothetical protein
LRKLFTFSRKVVSYSELRILIVSVEEKLVQKVDSGLVERRPLWRRVVGTVALGGLALAGGVVGYQKMNEKEPCSASFAIGNQQIQTGLINVPDQGVLFGRAERNDDSVRVAVGRNAFNPNAFVKSISLNDLASQPKLLYEVSEDTTLVLRVGQHAVTSSCLFSKSAES